MKKAIKAYEQNVNLPYSEVPPELCYARPGERDIDLSSWSILVTDSTLRRIASTQQDLVHAMAERASVDQVNPSQLRAKLTMSEDARTYAWREDSRHPQRGQLCRMGP